MGSAETRREAVGEGWADRAGEAGGGDERTKSAGKSKGGEGRRRGLSGRSCKDVWVEDKRTIRGNRRGGT